MRINKYRTELNGDQHNILVKESSCNYSKTENLDNPGKICNMLNDLFRLNMQAEEYIYMIALNTKQKVLGVFEISHGTVNASILNPRDVFIKALLCGASSIVLAHNHPSQDTFPSKMDIEIHRKIFECGELMNIKLLDSLIVGNGYYSFAENNRLN